MRSQYPQSSSRRAQQLAERARSMRFNPTASEARLFEAIRGRRLGAAFRRQVPVGSHIVDFLAPSARLVIEVDGGYHTERTVADTLRDDALRRRGYTVLRLDAHTIMRRLPEALQHIRTALHAAGG